MAIQPTIAAALIVKGSDDEASLLEQCLSNLKGHIDKFFIDINHKEGVEVSEKVVNVAKKYKADIAITIWDGNFTKARNNNFDRVPKEYDFILWVDSDDTIDKPEQLRKNIAILSPDKHGIFVKYDYDHDDNGNVTVSHWVARVVRNDGTYRWKSSIDDEEVSVHETLCEVVVRGKVMTEDFVVVHHATMDRRESSLLRNIVLLEGMLSRQKEKGKIDARTLFYLATHYFDAHNYESSVTLLREYLTISGWAEERCEAHVYIGDICRIFKHKELAYEEYIRGLAEYQNSPRPYLALSELSFEMGKYEDAANWIEKSLLLPKPSTTMVQRPMENSFRAYLLLAQAYINMGGKKINDAKKYVEKALALRPLDDTAREARDIVEKLIEDRENIKAASRIIKKFILDKTEDKIVPYINSLPLDIQDNPLIFTARHKFSKPVIWDNKSIVIYCGQGPLGIWGPWSLETGIGGSEEAVIQMSKRLVKLGWSVTVYATPGEKAGVYDGVSWKQYYEFNPHDFYNILVTWRNPWFFDADIKASKTFLWLHDVMENTEFTPERLEKIDKVIFVGKYHAELYRGIIPQDKWFISGNGIDPEAFISQEVPERKKHRMVYMSAYNRGLKIALDNWKEIKEAVPDATLDVYYGWQGYDAINANNPERMEWKNNIVNLINECKDVTDHGRIGHKQIIEEIKKADIFCYPCIFNEVYCISYVKAMAGGAYPVSSDYAELITYHDDGGVQVHYDEGFVDAFAKEYTKKLIEVLKSDITEEERQKMMQNALTKYSWERTAEQWSTEFNGKK